MSVVIEERALEMGKVMDELRKLTSEMEVDGVSADVMENIEAHFAQLVDCFWALHPSSAPEQAIRTLDNMNPALVAWFSSWLRQNEKQIPPVGMFGTRIWLCAADVS